MALGEIRTVTVTLDPSMPADIAGRAVVIQAGIDPNPDNNEVRFATQVTVQVEAREDLPAAFRLGEAYPNPFTGATTIPFEVKDAVHVRLELFDVTGRRVRTELDKSMPAGRYEHALRSAELPSGVYFYRIRMGGYERARSVVIIR
jgi:hypothetical protein